MFIREAAKRYFHNDSTIKRGRGYAIKKSKTFLEIVFYLFESLPLSSWRGLRVNSTAINKTPFLRLLENSQLYKETVRGRGRLAQKCKMRYIGMNENIYVCKRRTIYKRAILFGHDHRSQLLAYTTTKLFRGQHFPYSNTNPQKKPRFQFSIFPSIHTRPGKSCQ